MRAVKNSSLLGSIIVLPCFITIVVIGLTGCKKTTQQPGNNVSDKHTIDARLTGTWLWTQGSDGAYYDNYGAYIGNAYGFATQYSINADGTGSSFSHVFSTIGVGSGIAVDIASTGFFETDGQGHMGYFPTSGTYTSGNGGKRSLNADELYNATTKSGKSFLYQQLTFAVQGGRQCYYT